EAAPLQPQQHVVALGKDERDAEAQHRQYRDERRDRRQYSFERPVTLLASARARLLDRYFVIGVVEHRELFVRVVILIHVALPQRVGLRQARLSRLGTPVGAVFRVGEEAVLRELADAEEQDRDREQSHVAGVTVPPRDPDDDRENREEERQV